MIDIKLIKEKILEDDNNVRTILEELGCCRITGSTKEYRCARDINGDSNKICVKLNESLSSNIYELTPVKGDIFTLIMSLSNRTFTQSIELCCRIVGLKYDYNEKYVEKKPKRKAFGGFFTNIKKENEFIYNCYDNSILDKYLNKGSKRFKDDNIEYCVQTHFNIMFDMETNRIVTPWRDSVGRIIGIMGRYNASADYCDTMDISKWLPLKDLSFPKSNFLYGLYENYKSIQECGCVYVFESEKSVLQMYGYGIKNCVAIGSHDISNIQRRLLLSLGVSIIVCFDHDIKPKFLLEQCERLRSNSSLLKRKIGFAITVDILKGKESPSDRGLEVFLECVKEDNIMEV